ncbi:hypothetical protein ACT6NV_05290 [Robiginitalea sp. IMCC44478]|uniref:hypothetical protein n=1 Tax=Robiginitalea sp. IMCC44478 TaxID=3459122 RepID=UPI00404330B7
MKKCLFIFLALIGTMVLYILSASDSAAEDTRAIQAEIAQEGKMNKQSSDSSQSDTARSLFPTNLDK